MVLITSTFITDNGFASGLSPIVKIYKQDGTLVKQDNMSEVTNGNYSYDFSDYDKSTLYYFNMDADNQNVINRYQASNNELDYYNNKVDWKAIAAWSPGGNYDLGKEKKKEKELIEKIAKKVVELTPKQKEIKYEDKSKEIIGTIVEEIKNIDIEFDYDKIYLSIDEIYEKLKKDIKGINIKDNSNKIIKEVNKLDMSKKIDDIMELLKDLDIIKKKLDRKKLTKKDLTGIIPLEETEEFEELIEFNRLIKDLVNNN